MTTIQDKIEDLQRAVYRLDSTADRPLARRNARHKVLTALRAIRAQVDREFPALAVAKRQRKVPRPLTFDRMVAAMKKSGWGPCSDGNAVLATQAGIRVRLRQHQAFVPAWARAVGLDKPTELRRAKKSVTYRRAALAAQALARDEQ